MPWGSPQVLYRLAYFLRQLSAGLCNLLFSDLYELKLPLSEPRLYPLCLQRSGWPPMGSPSGVWSIHWPLPEERDNLLRAASETCQSALLAMGMSREILW